MIITFTVVIDQTLQFKVARNATIDSTVTIKQDVETKTAIDRNLLYTVCLEID